MGAANLRKPHPFESDYIKSNSQLSTASNRSIFLSPVPKITRPHYCMLGTFRNQ